MAHVPTIRGDRQYTIVTYLNEEEYEFVKFITEEEGSKRAAWVRSLIRRAMNEELARRRTRK